MGKQPHGERQRASPAERRHKTKDGMPTHSTSVNAIKSKIRDVTRLLDHSDRLPAGVRIEKERALAGYKQDLENALKEKRKQHMISKYHMVRFFERQKATRNLKKLKSRLAEAMPSSVEYQRLEKAMHQAEIDVNYTLYHPLTEKYLSLFQGNKGGKSASPMSDSSNGVTGQQISNRPHIWFVVEQCMQEGSLDALRDGKLSSRYTIGATETVSDVAKEQSPWSKTKQEAKGKAQANMKKTIGNDEDSDGGFFEP
ncbi:MAG: hypothetical protein Q9164_005501 [Protoblastenia rupestris]